MEKSILKGNRRFNTKTLIVTVDLSKNTNVGYCRCPSGLDLKPFPFQNTGDGYRLFWKTITEFQEKNKMEEVVVGYESTGVYGIPLVCFLSDKKVQVVQVNPCHTKRVKGLSDNSPNKDDYKDPHVIADIIELGRFLSVVIPTGEEAELRSLFLCRERMVCRCNTLYNQLHDLIFCVFPEFLSIMSDIRTKTSLHLLEEMPTPESIVRKGIIELTTTMCRISRGNFGAAKAQSLFAAAGNSIGIKHGRTAVLFEIKELLKKIKAEESSIEEIEKLMKISLKKISYSNNILSMKGIGELTTASLIGEFGNMPAFTSASEAIKFAGLNLFEISSGKHKGIRHISKHGRSSIRKLLYFAAMNTVRKGGIMETKYQSYVSNGMRKNKALIAIARKLLTIMIVLVKNNTVYDSNYVNMNIRKAA